MLVTLYFLDVFELAISLNVFCDFNNPVIKQAPPNEPAGYV